MAAKYREKSAKVKTVVPCGSIYLKWSQVQVNVNPNPNTGPGGALEADAPEIRKYKKKFSGEILCAALWGVNLLIGTDSGLMLLDRSGQGKGRSFFTSFWTDFDSRPYERWIGTKHPATKITVLENKRRYLRPRNRCWHEFSVLYKSHNLRFSVYQLITRRRFDQMAVLEGQNILVTISGRKRRIRVYYLSWLKQKILRTEGVPFLVVSPAILHTDFLKKTD